jgi:hypothetical protein
MFEPHDEAPADRIPPLVREMIRELGENPDREGLRRTPERVAESMRFLLAGYELDVEKVLNGAIFSEPYEEMVVVKDIEVYSLCEHHLLPFYGKAHVAYLPCGRIVGLSKIPRVVDVFAPPAGAGTADHPDRGLTAGGDQSLRRGGGDRGRAPLHDDAGHSEAEQRRGHVGHHRRLPHR